MNVWTVGIDPGATGAIAAVRDDGKILQVHDMPYMDGEVITALLRDIMSCTDPRRPAVAWVEKVGPMPKQGLASTWKFAQGYGAILGVLGALAIPTRRVTPAIWKRSMGLSRDKGASRRLACELWPAYSDLFRRVKDDGRAEAALIAEYGRRQELRA